jgi:hypothetical protein
MVHVRNSCLNCNAELDIEETTCPYCGISSIEEILTVECKFCGWQDELADGEPCPQCGEEMREVDD